MPDISLFALNSGRAFAEEVALRLGVPLEAHDSGGSLTALLSE